MILNLESSPQTMLQAGLRRAGAVEAYRDVYEYTTVHLLPAAAGAVQAGRARTPTPAP